METLYMECKIDNKYTTVQNAIEIMVDSLKAFIFENGDLLLPETVPLNIRSLHKNEGNCYVKAYQ